VSKVQGAGQRPSFCRSGSGPATQPVFDLKHYPGECASSRTHCERRKKVGITRYGIDQKIRGDGDRHCKNVGNGPVPPSDRGSRRIALLG
jgi:hypothetical protein